MIVASADTQVLPITHVGQVGAARRQIAALAEGLAFDKVRLGQLDIIASELMSNLHLHAKHGYLLVRTHGLVDGIELIAVDRGPGTANLRDCLRDGYSTAGTAGIGLGAIRRLAHVFDIHSQPGVGTVVLAQLHRHAAPAEARYLVGGVSIALAGEPICGDSWLTSSTARGARLAMADGLGHGEEAAQASLLAMRAVEKSPGQPTTRVIMNAHQAIAATRGAAMAICDIDAEASIAHFSGVGNVAGVIVLAGQIRSMVSYNGTVGHQVRKCKEYNYPWTKESMLIMYSDGLLTRWSLDSAPGLAIRHPSIIAAVLHRDFARSADDLCVAVLRERS